jgi:lipopolysaccharide heptosyltransferase II
MFNIRAIVFIILKQLACTRIDYSVKILDTSLFLVCRECYFLADICIKYKILLIRFSSFGDVTQTLSVPTKLKEGFGKEAEIHWVTRQEFLPLLSGHPCIQKVWSLNRKEGFKGLLKIIKELKNENFTHIYDAHNNIRSRLICLLLQAPFALNRFFSPPKILRKSQKRWKRFLLFNFRKNLYEKPFSGQRDLIEPLISWNISKALPPPPQIFVQAEALAKIEEKLSAAGMKYFTVLAPSAAHALKRWPIEHWIALIKKNPELKFIITGGPEDHFLNEITKNFSSQNVMNWAGQTNFGETVALISKAQALVANDTGVLHVAEQLGKPAIALMGPAPFGFPSRPKTKILELNLSCRPCSKHGQGPCTNEKFQKCLVDITPDQVSNHLRELLK